MPFARIRSLHLLGAAALAVATFAASLPAATAKTRKAPPHKVDDAPDSAAYGRREDILAFATDAAQRRGLDAQKLQSALAQARFVPTVARLIMPPPAGVAKNWAAYRARFVEPKRLAAGTAFWNANEKWLRLAQERYGVPPEIVVGIVGVETLYGQHMGSFRVIDALATLSFDFPPGRKDRSAFFREELENFFVVCQREGVDPLAWRGSYAGAIGMPQFMPSSILKHAVDFDADGRIDLHRDAADVIGSVANFLANSGWQRGLPTHFEVAPPDDGAKRSVLLGPDIVPSFTVEEFLVHGAALSQAAMGFEGRLALVELQNGDGPPSYVAGTVNFYAVTRYNWSSYYAMGVIALGEAVKQQRGR